MSGSTLYRLLDSLVKKGYLIEEFDSPASNGRPPKLYRVNQGAAKAIGVFFAWDSIGVSLLDIGGNFYEKKLFTGDEILSPRKAIKAVAEEVKSFQKRYNSSNEISGIGVSAFGRLSRSRGILNYGHHRPSPQWDYLPVKDLLEAETGLPVCLDNITGALLLQELQKNIELRQKRVAYIMLDQGIGSSFFAPGLEESAADEIAHIAHMTIDIRGKPCICGRRGCVETFVSREAIVNKILRYCPDYSLNPGEDPYAFLAKAAEDCGNKGVIRALWETAESLATAILNQSLMTFPDCVYLGGRIVQSIPSLIPKVEESVNSAIKKTVDLFKPFEIRKGLFNSDVLLYGSSIIMFRNRYGIFS
jgi:predicted NBD/HSP70 family sugar kinase